MIKKFVILTMFLLSTMFLVLNGCNNITTPSSITPTPTQSAKTGIIYGKVVDRVTEKTLQGVTITVDKKKGTLQTDENGLYRIEDLSPGKHTLTFERVSYKTAKKDIDIKEGEELEENVKLENTEITINKTIYIDTYISSANPNTNFSKDFSLHLSKDSRILLLIPSFSGVKVISATLYLHKKAASGAGNFLTFDIYPLIQTWILDEVTWLNCAKNYSWVSEGGTYVNVKVGHGYLNSVTNQWEEIDITDAFKQWETENNYGIIIITENTNISMDFNSYDDGINIPYVNIKLYIP